MKKTQDTNDEKVNKALNYLLKLNREKRKVVINLLKQVEQIQKSDLTKPEKLANIKRILWTNQSAGAKLWIGGVIGTLFGLLIFGTGGLGIAAMGGAFGVWAFLAGTTGGVLVSSLIQNFEKKK